MIWRVTAWTAGAALLLAPWIAMRFTDEVNWTVSDFVLFGAMIGTAELGFELVMRQPAGLAYRLAAALGLVTAFLLVWVNLAVGIIDDSGAQPNLMFAGVLAVALIGAVAVRLQPHGMAGTMLATAAAQAFAGGAALVAGWGVAFVVLCATGVFTALWLASAALFALAARRMAVA